MHSTRGKSLFVIPSRSGKPSSSPTSRRCNEGILEIEKHSAGCRRYLHHMVGSWSKNRRVIGNHLSAASAEGLYAIGSHTRWSWRANQSSSVNLIECQDKFDHVVHSFHPAKGFTVHVILLINTITMEPLSSFIWLPYKVWEPRSFDGFSCMSATVFDNERFPRKKPSGI